MRNLLLPINEARLAEALRSGNLNTTRRNMSQNSRLKRMTGSRTLVKPRQFRFSPTNTVFGMNRTNKNVNRSYSNALQKSRQSMPKRNYTRRPRLNENEAAVYAEISAAANSLEEMKSIIRRLPVGSNIRLKLIKSAIADFSNTP